MRRRTGPEKRNPDLLAQDGVSVGCDEGGDDGIEKLPRRVNRYGLAKKGSSDTADYMDTLPTSQGLARYARLLRSCGDYLIFRHYWTIDQVKLHGARLCKKHLLCPLCAIRRGAKFLAAYLQRYEQIKLECPNLQPYLVTLTVKDGADLGERFQHLFQSQRELWNRRKRGQVSSLAGVAGAVWSYEIKRGSGSGLWHPHLHMIALAEVQPDQAQLSQEWHAITGDSYIVDVRPINPVDPASGFVEVFKYAVKFSSQSPADTVHCFQTLSGKRLLASAGVFRGIPEPDDLLDSSEGLEGLPYVDLFYRYVRGGGYTLINTHANPIVSPQPSGVSP